MAHDAKPKAESEDQNLGKTKKALDNDSDYDSAEDDDFQEDDAISNESSDEEAGPSPKKGKKEDLDSGDEVTIVKAKKKRKGVEQEGQEDLILTRSQKRAKAEEGKAAPQAPLKQDKPEDLDALWKQLNDKKSGDHASTSSQVKLQSDTIKIKRTYEFAGQVVTEEKEVARDSAEAKAYLNTLDKASKPTQDTSKPAARRPVKRSSNLEAMAKGNKPAKLNVLEKSRLDWAGFVDKEGINDELKRYNKDGYIERQEFLKRAR